jgi:hypothetical protein
MNDFRGPLPLRDRDFREVRAKVMARIEGERRGRLSYIGLAATAAALLVLLSMPRREVVPMKTAPPRISATAPSAPAPIAQTPVTPKETHEPKAETADCACDVTMNIETADPNVRIIWIGR